VVGGVTGGAGSAHPAHTSLARLPDDVLSGSILDAVQVGHQVPVRVEAEAWRVSRLPGDVDDAATLGQEQRDEGVAKVVRAADLDACPLDGPVRTRDVAASSGDDRMP